MMGLQLQHHRQPLPALLAFMDTTNENSFILDTSSYIPREYFIEIKGKTHTEEIFYKEHIKFEIISEK